MARGFTQTPGLDYDETYSPTTKLSTIRTMLALGLQRGMRFFQMDIKRAYLNAPIEEKIFMEQPRGFETGGKDMVCKPEKSLYGLKQSGRNWFMCLSDHLASIWFKSSTHDRCLWIAEVDNHPCGITVWVDDILYGSTKSDIKTWFSNQMSAKFTVGENDDLSWFLGINFKTTPTKIELSSAANVK